MIGPNGRLLFSVWLRQRACNLLHPLWRSKSVWRMRQRQQSIVSHSSQMLTIWTWSETHGPLLSRSASLKNPLTYTQHKCCLGWASQRTDSMILGAPRVRRRWVSNYCQPFFTFQKNIRLRFDQSSPLLFRVTWAAVDHCNTCKSRKLNISPSHAS